MFKKSAFALIILFVSFFTNAQERIVLLEQFTNSGCPPCAADTPPVFSFTDNHPDKVVAVAYHTSFPYKDSMHFENVVENNQRVQFYSVGQVPYTIMDGNKFSGTSASFNSNALTLVNNRATINARYVIAGDSVHLTNGILKGTFRFTSTDANNTNENLVAQVVVIEKNVLKTAYSGSPGANAETEYGYVMRKFLPDAHGNNLVNKSLNGNDNISINWVVKKVKVNEEVRVVVFIQNKDTKEIYQAKMFTPIDRAMSLADQEKINSNSFIVYPNPSMGNLTLNFGHDQLVERITIVNHLGQTVFVKNIAQMDKIFQTEVALDNGIYFINVCTPTGNLSRKLLIEK